MEFQEELQVDRQKRTEDNKYVIGILIGITSALIVEAVTGGFNGLLLFVGLLLTIIFYLGYLRESNLHDWIEYEVVLTKSRKRIIPMSVIQSISLFMKDYIKTKYKKSTYVKKQNKGFNLFMHYFGSYDVKFYINYYWSIYVFSHYIYGKILNNKQIKINLLVQNIKFGDIVREAFRESLRYLHKDMKIINEAPKLIPKRYHFSFWVLDKKGKEIN